MSKPSPAARLAVALAVILVSGLTACSTTPRSTSEPETTSAAPAPTTSAPRTTRGWPTRRSGETMAWSAMAYPTGDARTSALGIEKGVPREVRDGTAFDWEVIVTNLTDAELSDVVVTESLGDGLRVTKSTPAAVESNQDMMTWALGDLGPRVMKTITVTSTATGTQSVSSCAAVTYSSTLCSVIPVVQPKLRLVKTGPAEVLACDDIKYDFEVTNTGTGTVRNVMIKDPLPQGLATGRGQTSVEFNVGSLGAGQSRRFSSTVKASGPGRYVNRATASGEGGLTATSQEVATVVRKPVLTISKTCPEKTFIGRAISFEITVRNTGDGVARDLVLEDRLPTGAQFVSASDGGRAAGERVVWNLGTLEPKGSKTVTMQCNARSAGSYRNTASARAFCAETVSDSCTTEVTGIPAILLEVVDIEDPIPVGENETYVITVTNQGSAPDTNIKIVVTLENSEHVSNTGNTRGTARGNQVIFEPLATLAPKAKATYRVVVRTTKAGDTRFKVSMTSDQLTRPVEETEATNIYE